MRRYLILLLLVITVVSAMVGCGGEAKKPDPPAIAVAVSPATATVLIGHTQQFTATVTNSTNTAVTWQVNGVNGGNATVGTISPAGLYTAPSAVPNPANVTITAVSQADTTKSASATVTVVTVSVAVTPSTASVVVNKTQQFTATVSNATNKAVTWQVNGANWGGAEFGSISETGLYTAPAAVPNPPTVTITAVAQADTTRTAVATATILPPPPVTVAVAPKTATVGVGGTQQFTANVANSDKGAIWAVNDIQGGDDVNGAISATGLYTAPMSVPTPSGAASVAAIVAAEGYTVTITATSVEDPTKVDTATVTITPPAPVTVTVAPKAVDVAVNATQKFVATVTGSSDTSVTWTVAGDGCIGNACGVIATDGTYTAPGTVPSSTVTITATSNADDTKSDTAVVTVKTADSNASKLNGKYAFVFSGYNSTGEVLAAGTFIADGHGAITGGVEDIRQPNGINSNLGLTGTYKVWADNRGELTLTTSQGSVVYRFALKADGNGRMIRFDNATGTGIHGAGQFKKQDATAYNMLNGDFVMMAAGSAFAASMPRAGAILRFTTDGAGAITNSLADLAVAGMATSSGPLASGSISDPDNTVNPYGRSKIALTSQGSGVGTLNFVAYMVTATEGFVIGLNGDKPALTGPIVKQVGAGTFSKASLNGVMVVQAGGYDLDPGGRTHTLLARINANGAGSLTGITDGNDVNEPQPYQMASLTGTYDVATTGRGQLSLTISGVDVTPVTIYLYDTNKGFMLEGVPNQTEKDVLTGTIEPQATAPFSAITGTFALGWSDPITPFVSMPVGSISFNSGTVTGTGDLDALGALKADQTVTGTYTITDTTTGRGTGSLTLPDGQHSFVFYMVSGTKIYANPSGVDDSNNAIFTLEQ